MKSCKEILKLNSPDHTKKLSFKEVVETKIHNLVCRVCRNYQKQLEIFSVNYKNKTQIRLAKKEKSIKKLEDQILAEINKKTGT